jgi:hypothetical protein
MLTREKRAHTRFKLNNILCDEWLDYSAFISCVGEFPKNQAIYRLDSGRKLAPDNYAFGTAKEARRFNNKNSKFYTHNGVTKCLAEWAADLGITKQAFHNRMLSGMEIAEAISMGHKNERKPIRAPKELAEPKPIRVLSETSPVLLECHDCGSIWHAIQWPQEKTSAELQEIVAANSKCKQCGSKIIVYSGLN